MTYGHRMSEAGAAARTIAALVRGELARGGCSLAHACVAMIDIAAAAFAGNGQSADDAGRTFDVAAAVSIPRKEPPRYVLGQDLVEIIDSADREPVAMAFVSKMQGALLEAMRTGTIAPSGVPGGLMLAATTMISVNSPPDIRARALAAATRRFVHIRDAVETGKALGRDLILVGEGVVR
jgi:hypothetical protein